MLQAWHQELETQRKGPRCPNTNSPARHNGLFPSFTGVASLSFLLLTVDTDTSFTREFMDTKQKRQRAKLVEVFFLGLAFLQMTTDNWVSN